jgi:hypothetical protein
MFDIYTKTVTIKGVTYEIKPLTGKHLPKLFGIAKVLGGDDEDKMSKLEDKHIEAIYELCLETFKKSYPHKSLDELEPFVTQNMLAIFPLVVEVNLGDNARP